MFKSAHVKEKGTPNSLKWEEYQNEHIHEEI
jgi:hypothetical protein